MKEDKKSLNQIKDNKEDKITRKEALKKVGKYAAFTAAATMLILTPKAAQADSPSSPDEPGGGW